MLRLHCYHGLLLLGLWAMGGMPQAAQGEEAKVTDTFRQLLTDEWEYTLRESPTFASYLGDKRYNDRWPDVSLAAIARRHEHQQQTLARLHKIDARQLSDSEQLNYRLFEQQIQNDLEAYPFRWHLVPLTQRDGIQDESQLAEVITFATVKDYEDWIARLRTFPAYMDQTIALMTAGVEQKIVQSKVVMQRLPEQIKKQLVEDPQQSLYYKPFLSFPEGISDADQARLKHAARAAIAEQVVPAYRKFATFFDEVYYPACFDEVGVWQVPRGREFYALRARQFTTTRLTPDEIHNIGLAEVKRIRAEMEAIVEQVKYEGTFQQFLQHLREDPKFYYQTPEELLNGYLALCKRIDPQLTKLFRKLPRIPYGLEAIPQHIAPDTTAAYYRPPAADGSRAGTYFVNLYRPDMRPKYEMEALSLHESVPGHHLQLALATELEDVPEFRRFADFTAYVEGWALYAESLGGELGCYQDPYSKFGQLTYEMWRAVRLVVDTGLHDKQWTRQQAIDFFKQNTAKTDLDIVNEVDRYIAWPGQALAYKIGELKIKELRRRATETLGEAFDIREFHEVILRDGTVPLDVLESRFNAWLAEKSKQSEP
jgi:prolyl oligopeptidase